MDEHVKKYQNFGIGDLHWKCISYAAAKLCPAVVLTKKRSPSTEWVCGRDGLVMEEHTTLCIVLYIVVQSLRYNAYIRTYNRS